MSAALFDLRQRCKVVRIGINVSLWDKHASPFGIACLMFCLVTAYFYKQAPSRGGGDLPNGVLRRCA